MNKEVEKIYNWMEARNKSGPEAGMLNYLFDNADGGEGVAELIHEYGKFQTVVGALCYFLGRGEIELPEGETVESFMDNYENIEIIEINSLHEDDEVELRYKKKDV